MRVLFKFLSGPFIIVAIGALSGKIKDNLISDEIGSVFPMLLAILLATVIVEILKLLITEIPMQKMFIRKWVLPESTFEGYWMEVVEKEERHYSFIEILFASGDYHIKATTYSQNGLPRGSWNSIFVKIKPETHELYYVYDAIGVHNDSGERINGYGEMRLEEASSKIRGGCGFFVDQGSNLKKCGFRFEEITKEYHKFLQKNDDKTFFENRQQFILKYDKEFCAQSVPVIAAAKADDC